MSEVAEPAPVSAEEDAPLNNEDQPLDNGDTPLDNGDTPLDNGDTPLNNGEIKTEVTENGTGSARRSSRKVQRKTFAENSDSSEQSDEDVQPVTKKAKTSKDTPTARRGRGRPRGSTTNKTPRSKTSDVGEEKSSTPARRGRGRPRGSTTKASAGRGRGKKAKPKPVSDDDDDDDDASDEDFDPGDEDDDFVPVKKSSGSKTGRQSLGRGRGGRGRGRGRGGVRKPKPRMDTEAEEDDDDDDVDDEDDEDDEEEEQQQQLATGETVGPGDPNSVSNGQYLIEKVDLRRLENYPIWRMEGPNMIRKFEMVVHRGRIRHKSLYAYSSWAQVMLELYTKIGVTQVCIQEGDTFVEVHEDYVPKPPNLESLEAYTADALYESYVVLVKALFNQALDNTFLQKIKDTNDAAFVSAINTVDTVVSGHVEKIESLVNMRDEFKTRVKNCPNMKSIKRQNWAQTDQATVDKSVEKGVRSTLMFGHGYDPFLLTEDKTRGVEVAQEIVIGNTMDNYLASYHGLFHFKYHMLKRCQDKVKLTKALEPEITNEDCVAKCLNDKVWVLMSFEDLKLLMNYTTPQDGQEGQPS